MPKKPKKRKIKKAEKKPPKESLRLPTPVVERSSLRGTAGQAKIVKKVKKAKPKKIKVEVPKEAKENEVKAAAETEKIRKNALQLRKEVEAAEQELLEKEKIWETPAFLRRQKLS